MRVCCCTTGNGARPGSAASLRAGGAPAGGFGCGCCCCGGAPRGHPDGPHAGGPSQQQQNDVSILVTPASRVAGRHPPTPRLSPLFLLATLTVPYHAAANT
eukprot:7174332-Prymnesium_polylepis.1